MSKINPEINYEGADMNEDDEIALFGFPSEEELRIRDEQDDEIDDVLDE